MLYPTHHHPFFITFNPFNSSISPHPSTTPLGFLSSSTSVQVEKKMECVEGALKSSFRPEMAVKTAQEAFFDDLWAVNGQSGVSGDDFFVDDLLDFSKAGNEEVFVVGDEEEDQKNSKGCSVSVSVSVSDNQQEAENEKNSVKDGFGSVPGSELSVPADDLADLEWLSHFVEDSFSEYSLTYPAGKLTQKPTDNLPETEIPVQAKPCFTTPIQTKARSKRARTGGRIWSLGSPSLTESCTSSSSSSSSTTTSSLTNPWLIYMSVSQTAESFLGKPPVKKQKQKKPAIEGLGGGGTQQPRRCSHCGVQKTPQWRAGPLGAKTLCNACGVRFKSGRLLPEYRPAGSPTFSSEIHSNNHRKVMEMRRKREVETGFSPAGSECLKNSV